MLHGEEFLIPNLPVGGDEGAEDFSQAMDAVFHILTNNHTRCPRHFSGFRLLVEVKAKVKGD